MANQKLAVLDIDPSIMGDLAEIGIRDTRTLLAQGRTIQGRQVISSRTGLPADVILQWVHFADLCRIRGVGTEYSQLLGHVGVATLRALRSSSAPGLVTALAEANDVHHLARRLPSEAEVGGWIQQAFELDAVVEL